MEINHTITSNQITSQLISTTQPGAPSTAQSSFPFGTQDQVTISAQAQQLFSEDDLAQLTPALDTIFSAETDSQVLGTISSSSGAKSTDFLSALNGSSATSGTLLDILA